MGGAEYLSNLTDEQWRIIENSCQSRKSEVASRLIGGVFSTRSCTGIGPGVSSGTCRRNFPNGTRCTLLSAHREMDFGWFFCGELAHDRPYVDGVIPHSLMSWRCRGVGSV